MNGYVKALEHGSVAVGGESARLARIEQQQWNKHPVLEGVALKHLLTAAQTGGNMSLHLVRIDPGCAIAAHEHEKSWELHQVVDGQGECLACGELFRYVPGVQASLPNGAVHEVRAGEQGLTLIATFSPPLL